MFLGLVKFKLLLETRPFGEIFPEKLAAEICGDYLTDSKTFRELLGDMPVGINDGISMLDSAFGLCILMA